MEVIAEAGLAPRGNVGVALEMVDAALGTGCHAVKFQTYRPEKLLRQGDPHYKVLSDLTMSQPDFIRVARHCEKCGIEFMSTPGDLDSLKFLVEELGVKRIKLGSDDITYFPLIKASAATNLPIILSTGMATMKEVVAATMHIKHDKVSLLHCVSVYPTQFGDANLRAITALERLGYPVGYSDHCQGYLACLAAAGRGAKIIEKHFMLKKYETQAPDAAVSITEDKLLDLVVQLHDIDSMLGSGVKEPCEAERENIRIFRKGTDGFRGLV